MDLTAAVQRLTKVDYLDGLGVAVSLRDVSFVHMSKRALRVSLRNARTVPLPESGQERVEAYGRALSQFLRDIEVTPDHVYGYGDCADQPQPSCWDLNRSTVASGISAPETMPFQNRPTFQQTVELTQHLPR